AGVAVRERPAPGGLPGHDARAHHVRSVVAGSPAVRTRRHSLVLPRVSVSGDVWSGRYPSTG
ncbi:hypothetical protein, partial [Saccharomonospora halophila]|uniref:hypothetical protein n=1 Tax=Saccharomonospora halophila TaxID=129922 RepID=UPI00048BEF35